MAVTIKSKKEIELIDKILTRAKLRKESEAPAEPSWTDSWPN